MAKKAAIKPDPRNARLHPERNLKAVEQSLKELGAGRSIVVDRNGVIIGGNAVYEKAKELGIPIKEVETDGSELVVVRRVDLDTDDPRRKALALADNQIALLAEWDLPVLKNMLDDLRLAELDLEATGFDATSLRDILPPERVNDDDDAAQMADRAEELNEKWQVKRGHVWEIPSKSVPGRAHRVMCGDSTDEGDVERLLNGAEPYLMVTDPPYGVDYDPNWRNEAAAKGWIGQKKSTRAVGRVTNDDNADWRNAWVLFPVTVAYVWHAGTKADVVAASLQDTGFEIRTQIIWAKNNFAIGRGHYHVKHEPCWYVVRRGESARWLGGRKETTLWEIDKNLKSETGHSTQKPIECMARPIRNHDSPEVCDPFLGSGTTVVAAEQEGRICYGMEICEKYVSVTLERLSALGLEPHLGA